MHWKYAKNFVLRILPSPIYLTPSRKNGLNTHIHHFSVIQQTCCTNLKIHYASIYYKLWLLPFAIQPQTTPFSTAQKSMRTSLENLTQQLPITPSLDKNHAEHHTFRVHHHSRGKLEHPRLLQHLYSIAKIFQIWDQL